MPDSVAAYTSLSVFVLLTLLLLSSSLSRGRFHISPYFRYLWAFFLIFSVAELGTFTAAVWILAFFSFIALREFFSLVDIRLQDRWGILIAYLSIPFMIYLIQIDWYGLFIISIPVYTFLVVPFLVVLGGSEKSGTVFSIGSIDLGLFLFVFCMGHIGYLLHFSTCLAIFITLNVASCDLIISLLRNTNILLKYLLSSMMCLGLLLVQRPWIVHPGFVPFNLPLAVPLTLLIPLLVIIGHFTLAAIEADLGICKERLEPGRGRVLHSIKSYLFVAPVAFHYLRWFLHWGDI
jgi:phosphatidate cytidylyltransferase